jgi:hypothetical protein
MYVYVCVRVFEDSILSFHKHDVIFFTKKLKKYKSDIKESGIRLFFGPTGLSYAPFATICTCMCMRVCVYVYVCLYLEIERRRIHLAGSQGIISHKKECVRGLVLTYDLVYSISSKGLKARKSRKRGPESDIRAKSIFIQETPLRNYILDTLCMSSI